MRALLACAAIAACTGPAPEVRDASPGAEPPRPQGELARTIAGLAEDALARGELEVAEARFQRLLAANPRSERALAGLGRVAYARGDLETARARFESALDSDAGAVDALVGLARIERDEGNPGAASEHLIRALERDGTRPEVHALLAAVTGHASRRLPASVDEALRLADAHPYDPWALLQAGQGLASAGEHEQAVAYLENAVWLADLDPASATTALRLLPSLSEEWSGRRVVPVHSYADEGIRAREGWRFQLRAVWLAASNALSNILDIRFIPVSIGDFRSAESSPALESIHQAFQASAGPFPPHGILAGFTERAIPRHPGAWKRGLAEFLGRRLTVRLDPGSVQSRVLAHEILHLFGAIHVARDLDSLMNPAGHSIKLDPLNYRIARALRHRQFASGGLESNVLPWIDLSETIDAYVEALKVNLTFRRIGVAQLLETQRFSRYQAAREAREVLELDPHLADVARVVSVLMLADDRRVEALVLLDLAADLYGPDTKRGRAAFQSAEALRKVLLETLEN